MTDLSKGFIRLNEMMITPDTTKDDLMRVYGEELNTLMSNATFLDFNRLFQIENHNFMVMFSLNEGGKISSIKLTPYINYKSEKWDRTGRQEERRQFCDKWLFDHLGDPILNNGGALYEFDAVRISCVTHFDIHQGADAGYIAITYR